ncbi:MAG: c-type cytochrome [Planctomycetes bacterium]|nr:c-type cytochrome [Planctomycetota bacterium]
MALLSACGGGNGAPANNVPVGPKPDFGAAIIFAAAPTDDDVAELAQKGRDVMGKYNCISCHSLGDKREALNGPPLGKVGARYRTRHKDDLQAASIALFNHVRDPEAYPGFFHGDPAYSGQKMPAYPQITDPELRLLVHFLLSKE